MVVMISRQYLVFVGNIKKTRTPKKWGCLYFEGIYIYNCVGHHTILWRTRHTKTPAKRWYKIFMKNIFILARKICKKRRRQVEWLEKKCVGCGWKKKVVFFCMCHTKKENLYTEICMNGFCVVLLNWILFSYIFVLFCCVYFNFWSFSLCNTNNVGMYVYTLCWKINIVGKNIWKYFFFIYTIYVSQTRRAHVQCTYVRICSHKT